MPVSVTGTEWYNTAREHLLRYQQQQVAEEEAALAKDVAPVLEELKDVLAALEAAALKGSHVLVQHVYQQHPPR